jgi:hypothetical protein
MSAWLAKARERRTQLTCARPEACANCAKTSQSAAQAGSFGTNGTIGTASGIPPDEIRFRFRWIAQRLVEEHRRDIVHARRDALAILKVELLNDLRFAPVQVDTHHCFVCSKTQGPHHVLVPVLTARHDTPLWLHLEPCYGEHRRPRSGVVDEHLHRALFQSDTSTDRGEVPQGRGDRQSLELSRRGPAS